MDQTPEWQNLIAYSEHGSEHWSPAQSKLLSLGKCHTLWFNHKVSYPLNKEWQAVCCVNEGYIRFGSPALYKEGVNDANYFYFTKTNHGNSLEPNCKTSTLIDISMYKQIF